MNNNSYKVWLNNLVEGRKLLEELTDEERYMIILKIAQIVYSRNNVVAHSITSEDIASDIYLNYCIRDKQKDLSDTYHKKEKNKCVVYKIVDNKDDIIDVNKYNIDGEFDFIKYKEGYAFATKVVEEYPYYDPKSRTYFKNWLDREDYKGWKRMIDRKMTIAHFSNMIFQEVKNAINYSLRPNAKNMFNNNSVVSLSENNSDEIDLIEKIEDKTSKNQTIQLESDLAVNNLINYIDEFDSNNNYCINLDGEIVSLSYANLMKLYGVLANDKKISDSRIIDCIYKSEIIDNRLRAMEELKLDTKDRKFIRNFISDFKNYLLETGIINKEEMNGEVRYSYGNV